MTAAPRPVGRLAATGAGMDDVERLLRPLALAMGCEIDDDA